MHMGGFNELAVVTLLALLVYSILGVMVGRARREPDRFHPRSLDILADSELSLRRRPRIAVCDRANHLRGRLPERGFQARTRRNCDLHNQRNPRVGKPYLDRHPRTLTVRFCLLSL